MPRKVLKLPRKKEREREREKEADTSRNQIGLEHEEVQKHPAGQATPEERHEDERMVVSKRPDSVDYVHWHRLFDGKEGICAKASAAK
jgi:hypothetical protein